MLLQNSAIHYNNWQVNHFSFCKFALELFIYFPFYATIVYKSPFLKNIKMKNLKNSTALLIMLMVVIINLNAQEPSSAPIRLVIVGMTHGHTSFILGRKNKTDFKLVGVYEPNHELALRYSKTYNFSPELIYSDLNKMLDSVKPEAAVAFGSIFDHMMMVEACAPRGIHMMVEKPLATNS